jgi:hypothetical protein
LHTLQRIDHIVERLEVIGLLAEHVKLTHDRPPYKILGIKEFYLSLPTFSIACFVSHCILKFRTAHQRTRFLVQGCV